ncbi:MULTISPECIES: type II toxin-antitoxin system HipA family toxin [unclassified Bradyrhizobium]|uniref:type II toxin-antitoxin system HipA family toxin n=1 Tax=unclassified Bradyrhizobium TaxID=2631580 RepID=UPI001FFA7091|nr:MULTISPECIES: type II toxin-antitoxin system HipA family toxin [unclassified Bradyrhizobium]MCK1267657.1 type II toxin-antitoxin system HipA family toxin [Bradyrhizobium sp. 84]MCK1308731.1 type II toxin-antitoxin system HipA family toxin [Bradyrhizobium sp. 45]MCK1370373.1 type II toxin-antitoxin system HipA family toxin [Bradyrhizobium sp. 49]MCK1672095.1 type II toxin-antitoxin system HipA family toxin [Bradyrhizobium sp. 150]
MNKPVLAAERIQSLDISLNDLAVGTLVRTPGDYSAFNLLPAYRSLNDPPIFSLSLRSADGSLRRDPKPIRGALPPFFANLLPEEKLREAMEKHHAASVRPGNDFDLLAALGTNLPGAVRALPSDGVPVPAGPESEGKKKARFSLAGVQMKLSVIKNTGKGGITLAVDDEQGQYIAKFPSLTHIGLSENEFAILALAEALGMEVPARELVEKTDFAGIPEELNTMSTGKVLLVRRFDRGADAARVHMEDFAQVFGRYPSEKYTGAAYHNIAAALNSGVSFDSAIEFVRRLALSAITGNGDMHLKNWSLLYPGEGRRPTLAPIYDVLSTVSYIPKDGLALSLAGEKSFKPLTPERWRNFANRSRLPEGAVVTAVAETAAAVRDKWSVLPERDVVPGQVLERIDAHIDEMVSILDP